MKRENLKKDYEIKEMRKDEFENFKKENENFRILSFENEDDYFMVKEDKKNLFIIHLKKNQIHEKRDRDIKIDSRKIDNINIKLIYHRDSKNEKEYRIFLSFKKDDKLIRRRLRNEKIDSISRDEKKMIEYYQKISMKEIKEKIS